MWLPAAAPALTPPPLAGSPNGVAAGFVSTRPFTRLPFPRARAQVRSRVAMQRAARWCRGTFRRDVFKEILALALARARAKPATVITCHVHISRSILPSTGEAHAARPAGIIDGGRRRGGRGGGGRASATALAGVITWLGALSGMRAPGRPPATCVATHAVATVVVVVGVFGVFAMLKAFQSFLHRLVLVVVLLDDFIRVQPA